jgi:hypothetical protein
MIPKTNSGLLKSWLLGVLIIVGRVCLGHIILTMVGRNNKRAAFPAIPSPSLKVRSTGSFLHPEE